jgi:membrane protease YdiL (CAAX protease family)
VRLCPSCGASSPASAPWCSQCYASLEGAAVAAPAETEPETAPPPAPAYAAAAADPRFNWNPAETATTAATTPMPAPSGPAWSPAPAAWPAPTSGWPPPHPGPPAPGAWAPPAPGAWAPPAPGAWAPPAAALAPPPEGGLLSHRAFVLTIVAICVGAVSAAASYLLSRDTHLTQATYLRYALVITLAVYAVVGVLVVTQIASGVRLRWHGGHKALSVATGLVVGGALSVLGLSVVSAAAGHLNPDPRIVTLMSEGDAPHIFATVLIACVAAPLIEETLFRGLLLESLRGHGNGAAIFISGLAFAAWHLNPAALVYYSVMGGLLGLLYVKRGLMCSMAAHLAFNGVLTIAAVVVVTGAGPLISNDGLSMHTPSGWTAKPVDLPTSFADVHESFALAGPSGAAFVAMSFPTPVAPDPDLLMQRLSTTGRPGFGTAVKTDSLREVKVPAGMLVEVDATIANQPGTIAFMPRSGRTYELVFESAGSPKAAADFAQMLRDLRVS